MTNEIHCQEFHELAMDYRAAGSVFDPHGPQKAYERLCKYVNSRLAPPIASSAPADELPHPAFVKGCHDYYSAEQIKAYGHQKWQQALDEADIIHKGLLKTMAESAIAAQQAAPKTALTDEQIIAACDGIYLSDHVGARGSMSYDVAVGRAVLAALASLPVPPMGADK